MNPSQIENLEKLLAQGQDSTLLRFGLGNAHLQAKNYSDAVVHLRAALEMDKHYSAAWKLLAKALNEDGQVDAAIDTYEEGIGIANEKGDLQAVKEMKVFLKRLKKQRDE